MEMKYSEVEANDSVGDDEHFGVVRLVNAEVNTFSFSSVNKPQTNKKEEKKVRVLPAGIKIIKICKSKKNEAQVVG
jgi:hypothetical protein